MTHREFLILAYKEMFSDLSSPMCNCGGCMELRRAILEWGINNPQNPFPGGGIVLNESSLFKLTVAAASLDKGPITLQDLMK